jgi:tRNA pseudouridine55 synthase
LSTEAISPGIYLIHKKAGETSFSVVQHFRAEIARTRPSLRVCHGGALDPFAEGLLLVLVGPATKLMEHLHVAAKTYEATIEWGSETDNGDPTGRVVARGDPSALNPAQVEQASKPFVGWLDQIPPATSNKRVAGERAYQKAHRGETVDLPPSRVYLNSITWIGHELPARSRVRLVTGGGFYVRALARDLGRSLSCRAHVSQLQRRGIGPWVDPLPGERLLVRGMALLPWCASRGLSDAELGEIRAGRDIPLQDLVPPTWVPPFDFENTPIRAIHQARLLALLRRSGERLAPRVMLGRGL